MSTPLDRRISSIWLDGVCDHAGPRTNHHQDASISVIGTAYLPSLSLAFAQRHGTTATMMTNPRQVDVNVPDTTEARLVSRQSTDNLQRLVNQQRHHAQHVSTTMDMAPASPSVYSATSAPLPSSSSPNAPRSLVLPAGKEHETTEEYTAWTIGSTEILHNQQLRASPPPVDVTSPYKSAILANLSRQPSPAPTDTSSMSATPPPHPTLGGLSQGPQLNEAAEGQLPPRPASHMDVDQGPACANGGEMRVNQALHELYQARLLSTPSSAVESLLSSSCEALNFDIAEMWLRTGPKTHQLTNPLSLIHI